MENMVYFFLKELKLPTEFSPSPSRLARFLLSLSLSLSLIKLTAIFLTGSFGYAKTAEVSAVGGYPLTVIGVLPKTKFSRPAINKIRLVFQKRRRI
jgi:hypothetical protein